MALLSEKLRKEKNQKNYTVAKQKQRCIIRKKRERKEEE